MDMLSLESVVLELLLVHQTDQLIDSFFCHGPHGHSQEVLELLGADFTLGNLILLWRGVCVCVFVVAVGDRLDRLHVGLRTDVGEFSHDLVDLRHGFETKVDHGANDDLSLYSINFESLGDDRLDELDLVDEDLVILVQAGQHVPFS